MDSAERPRRKAAGKGAGARRVRERSLYDGFARHLHRPEDVMPELLALVTGHVEALMEASHPLAALMGERLRRSLVRLEPLLDETLAELRELKDTDLELAACAVKVRDRMQHARGVLGRSGQRVPALPPPLKRPQPTGELGRGILRVVERLERGLRSDGGIHALSASEALLEAIRDLARAKHLELRARLVLEDAQCLLRHALRELTLAGRTCEVAFPEVARRVNPTRVAELTEQQDRFEIQ